MVSVEGMGSGRADRYQLFLENVNSVHLVG